MRFFPLETLFHVVVHVMPFRVEIESRGLYGNTHKRLLLLGTTKYIFHTNCNSGGITALQTTTEKVDADSMNVVQSDSPPLEGAYCFLAAPVLHVIPFRCVFLTVAPNDTRRCHIHLIACTTFPPPVLGNRQSRFCVNHFPVSVGGKLFPSGLRPALLLSSPKQFKSSKVSI